MAFDSILKCVQHEVESIIMRVRSGFDFVPMIEIDTDSHTEESGYDIKYLEQKCCLDGCLDNPHPAAKLVEIDKEKGEQTLALLFCVAQGKKKAKDKNGFVMAQGTGVQIITQSTEKVAYGDKIELKISTENIQPDAKIDFYAMDNSSDWFDWDGNLTDKILCGVTYIGYKQNCFCNRDLTVDELKKIVKNIRDNTYYDGKTVTSYHEDKLFYLYAKVPKSDQTL